MLYNAMGILSSIMFLGCLFGLVKQFQQISKRKQLAGQQEKSVGFATQSLSVNNFFSSFVAFYAFFVYSMMLQDIDYYLLITRLLAASATMVILYEVFRDREQLSQKLPFICAVVGMFIAFICFEYRESLLVVGRSVASILAVGATFVILQGGVQQIRKIRKEKTTGALSFSMNVIFMCKDLSNLGFGAVLGFTDGWPLILIGLVSSVVKAITLWQFKRFKAMPSCQ
ncbi:MAG: putative ABC-type sugar transport system permease subunit [Oceanospirillaceae bacterium]|jgi:predicted ABC-type sugar transport system permease subunit